MRVCQTEERRPRWTGVASARNFGPDPRSAQEIGFAFRRGRARALGQDSRDEPIAPTVSARVLEGPAMKNVAGGLQSSSPNDQARDHAIG